MTSMQQQAVAVLNAIDEGKVLTVITLYDHGCIDKKGWMGPRLDILKIILISNEFGICMSEENADYWLDWFGVK